jgi:hypothetical protein
MMDLCIVWEREDGGVSVTHPAPNARKEGETDEQFLDRIRLKDVPDGKPFHVQRKESLPSRRFRNAWTRTSDGIEIDTPRARGLLVAEVRAERNRRLAETDTDKSRIDEIGTPQEQKAIKDKRQKLRDLPAVVESEIATLTVEQLEAYQPAWPS